MPSLSEHCKRTEEGESLTLLIIRGGQNRYTQRVDFTSSRCDKGLTKENSTETAKERWKVYKSGVSHHLDRIHFQAKRERRDALTVEKITHTLLTLTHVEKGTGVLHMGKE